MGEARDSSHQSGEALGLTATISENWEANGWKQKEKKTYWKFPTTLLPNFMWSEPSCLGKPGDVVFIPGDSVWESVSGFCF